MAIRDRNDGCILSGRRMKALWIALVTCCLCPQTQAEELQVWIRAFIPKEHPGNKTYVRPVPQNPGHWMIPAPSLGSIDKLTQLVSSVPLEGDTCFATDDRGFDETEATSARLTTAFKVAIDGQAKVIEPLVSRSVNFPGQSKAYKCSTGELLMSKPGRMQIDAVGGPHIADGKTQVIVQAAASLPFISGSAWIDYSADFVFDKDKNTLSYRFTVDRFPAYEAYARIGGGAVRRLFAINPEGDNVWSLFDLGVGATPRVLSGEVKF